MTYSFVISPVLVQEFESEDELIERCKEWNLLSSTATRVKTYLYKRQGLTLPCGIVGYVDPQTVVIQFENKQQHCIHPAYLKEMQTAGFGSRAGAVSEAAKADEAPEAGVAEEAGIAERAGMMAEADVAEDSENAAAVPERSGDALGEESASISSAAEAAGTVEPPEAPKKPVKSKKKPALVLPEDKLQMTAIVKEFTTVPNHFSDNDDEVIIYEGVTIEGHDLAIEEVWSSHSATLKKLELAVGDKVSFEAKIVAKKLTQHPVRYKINNPSKMKKLD
ncbi:hypothetical protein [Paenibacillus sp. S150]|uniref:hypothetical protein n=1 Tax=Paenibacillus sp. S150 TaxID=2749826 RepID=UPI001C57B391|nr:hypothetical protein [Paenibacillus sp. S150]MBW4081111.1 hypothetical protein [Paenibacillus sp. S150]